MWWPTTASSAYYRHRCGSSVGPSWSAKCSRCCRWATKFAFLGLVETSTALLVAFGQFAVLVVGLGAHCLGAMWAATARQRINLAAEDGRPPRSVVASPTLIDFQLGPGFGVLGHSVSLAADADHDDGIADRADGRIVIERLLPEQALPVGVEHCRQFTPWWRLR